MLKLETSKGELRTLRCLVITLSDRAAAGEYPDRSGPRIIELLKTFFASGRCQLEVAGIVLPDEPEQIRQHIRDGIANGIDVILTTGGTGLGPRDLTPDTVAPLCEKLIPGIMEHIRTKFGATNPRARLSRAIAGVAGKTQIYTLPGSVRAVEEYLGEILVTLEHLALQLQGRDDHEGQV
jgi:molybdenum cofactor synthesis domain-containing protein